MTALSADTGTAGDFITNVASQTVSGTFTGALGAGEKIQVSANGGTTWVDATVGPGSSWSASGVTLSAGTGTLLVQSIDTAGNATAGPGHSYTLQTSGPSAIATVTALSADTGTAGDFITNVASQTVSGTFTGALGAGEKIQVSADGGTTWVDATVGPGSSWSASGVTLSAGAGTLSVRSIDAANNTTAGTGHSYTLDATPPSETFPTVTLTSDTGASNADFITSSGGVHFAGTVADTGGAGIASVQVFNGATLLGTATVVGGNWSLDTTLAAGTYNNLKVTVTDLAGNANTTTNAQTLIVDATPPSAVATVTALSADTGTAGDFITNVASQTVSGTFTGALGAGEKIQVSADGGTTWVDATVGPGIWSASGVTLSAGTGTLLVQSIDTAGNATAGPGHSYTLQTSGPSAIATVTALSADTGTAGDFITNVASQTVSGTFTGALGAGEKIQVSADGGTTWVDATVGPGSSWSASGVTLSAGAGTLSVRSIDAANNTTAGTGHGYTLDATPPSETFPTVTLTSDTGASNADFITSNGGVHFAGTVADTGGAGIASVQVFNGATLLGTATVVGGNWSLDTTLAAGTYNNLKVTVTDLAGNANTTTNAQTLIVDATPPSAVATVTALSADTGTAGDFITNVASQTVSGTFTGALGAGEKIQVSANGGTTWVDATAGAGTWSASGVTLSAGTGTLLVQSIDTAGNATAGPGHSYTLQTSGPSAIATVTALSADTGTAGDFITNVASQTVSGTFTGALGAGEKIQVSADGGTTWVDATVGPGSSWSASGVTLSAGAGTLSVRSIDAANNTTAGTGHSYTLDATPPSETFPTVTLTSDTGASNADFITSSGGVHFAGTVADTGGAGIASVQVFNGATLLGTATVVGGNWSLDTTLAAGTYNNLKVTVTDLAGNANTTTNAQTLIVDATPPAEALAITAITTDTGTVGDFITSDTTLTVSGSNGALAAGEKIQVSSDGANWFDATPIDSTHWSYDDTATSHTSSFTYRARIVDIAGNIGTTASQAITIDTTPPTISGDLAITVNNASSVVLTSADFHAVDANSTAGQQTFTVSNPTNGYVAFAATLGTPITSFTEADLEAGLVAFVHDGSKTIEATFKVSVSDGASSSAPTTIHASVATISIVVRTPSGMNFQNEDTIAALGAGVLQSGNTSTAFTLVNIAANRDFVFEGTGFQWTNGVLTAGTILAIHELTHDTQSLLVDFTGHIDAPSFYSAAVAQASGDDSVFNALTSQWVILFVGNGGNDAFASNDANDFFKASGGNDLFIGGFGFDRANYASLSGPIAVQLAAGIVTKYADTTKTTVAGADTLQSIEFVTGTDFADTFNATGFSALSQNSGSTVASNTDGTINDFEGRGGDDLITGNGINTRISYLHATGPVTVDLAAGTADGDASVGHDTFTGVNRVRGSYFADTLLGSNNPSGTAEFFEGRGGDDFIDGRGGFDRAVYLNEDAAIVVHLAAGDVFGGPNTGHDTLRSIESIFGTNFADTFDATGFTASSTNAGSAGVNGAGAAFNEFEGAGGNDTIIGNGNTRIAFYDATAGVTVTFTSIGAGTSQSTASGDAAGVGIDTFSGVNSVRGSAFDDIIGPDAGNNVFDGQAGNDTLWGGGGNDTLIGGDGIDRALYVDATGPITVNMAAGTVSGAGVGVDTLSSVESIRGSNFADNYDASNFSSTSTNAGSNGTFNVFVGGSGDDTITGNGNTQVQYFNATSAVLITLGANGSGSASGDSSVGNDIFVSGVNNVLGSNFNDTYNASAFTSSSGAFNQFQGLGGNDTITGNGGTQLYYAGSTAGISVTLNAGGGGTVTGNSSVGTDTINGGVNSIQGSNFNDTYNASAFSSPSGSFNQFLGNGGNDTITGNGNTQLYYGATTAGISATLNAGGTGTVTGDSSVGSDTINGGVNNIFGSNFNDTFTLNSPGANFQSTLTGNGGNDTFVFKPNFGKATITDFHSGQDTIDFDPTVFSDFSAVQSHMTAVGANTVITFDAGDTVTLVNVAPASLHASDFHFV